MISDLDIYRSASRLIQRYGDKAAIRAAMQANHFLKKGNLEGRAVWLRIKKAVDELQDQRPRSMQCLH